MPFILPGGAVVETDTTISEVSDEGSPIRLHTEIARDRCIERWKDKPAFQAWLRSYAEAAQELELVLWDVYALRFPDFAEGHALDVLGRIVGVDRGNREDGPYCARIKVQIAVNASQGRADDLLSILRLLTDVDIDLRDFPGGLGFTVEVREAIPSDVWVEVPSILRAARAAGVGASVVAPQPNANGALRCGDIAARPSVGGPLGDIASRPSVGAGLADYRRI